MGVSVSIFTGMIVVKVTVESGKKDHFSLKLAVSGMRKKDTSKTPHFGTLSRLDTKGSFGWAVSAV